MSFIQTLKWEWIQFRRTPFQYLAVLLFVLAAVYSISNGISLREKQLETLAKVESDYLAERSVYEKILESGGTKVESRPWVDLSTPFYGMWNSIVYKLKTPSPMMSLAIGQAEQYGFYKRLTFYTSGYDSDLSAEISNPERIAFGALDLTFCVIFLLPLLLIVLCYPIGGYEEDVKMAPLVQIQGDNYHAWIWKRTSAIGLGASMIVILLIAVPSIFSGAFTRVPYQLFTYSLVIMVYLWFWIGVISAIISLRLGQTSQTMGLVLVWVVFGMVIPGAVQQGASLKFPNSMLVDYLDAKRIDQGEIYEADFEAVWDSLRVKLPEIEQTKLATQPDSAKIEAAKGAVYRAEVAFHMKEVSKKIEAGFQQRNDFIESSYWYNPLMGIQNYLYSLAETDFYAYQEYRVAIQDASLELSKKGCVEEWNDEKVDLNRFRSYFNLVSEK